MEESANLKRLAGEIDNQAPPRASPSKRTPSAALTPGEGFSRRAFLQNCSSDPGKERLRAFGSLRQGRVSFIEATLKPTEPEYTTCKRSIANGGISAWHVVISPTTALLWPAEYLLDSIPLWLSMQKLFADSDQCFFFPRNRAVATSAHQRRARRRSRPRES